MNDKANNKLLDCLRTEILSKLNLSESLAFHSVGMQVESHEGAMFIHCPHCSTETHYYAFASKLNCLVCGVVDLAPIIANHYQSSLVIRELASEAGVVLEQHLLSTYQRPTLSLLDIKDFLNAQLTVNFRHGLSSCGWTDDDINNALLGSVSEDAEMLWTKFNGTGYEKEYARWHRYTDHFLMPFYDGQKVNAIILPPDFSQEDEWSPIDYQFLLPPSFWRIWLQNARQLKGEKIIVVSNPLYAVYLLAQNKPAIFIHAKAGERLLSDKDAKHCYVFEEDLVARTLLPISTNIIDDEGMLETQSIWTVLKAIDLNKERELDWKGFVYKALKQGVPFYKAVEQFESVHKSRILVGPV
ncbi:MAG: hypothetical protein ACI936_001369 [Paraglaciecola sp.]|jgi:hypothetical protein